MKAVLISIKPKWCNLIADGKKTIEIRKTKPNLQVPFKCYIYCTQNDLLTKSHRNGMIYVASNKKYKTSLEMNGNLSLSGKVIGEFMCEYIGMIPPLPESLSFLTDYSATCMSLQEVNKYGNGKILYGWHISGLVIYDKPKGLNEFHRKCERMACEVCEHLKYQRVNNSEYDYECEFFQNEIPITRPPQSWCYVEELEE